MLRLLATPTVVAYIYFIRISDIGSPLYFALEFPKHKLVVLINKIHPPFGIWDRYSSMCFPPNFLFSL